MPPAPAPETTMMMSAFNASMPLAELVNGSELRSSSSCCIVPSHPSSPAGVGLHRDVSFLDADELVCCCPGPAGRPLADQECFLIPEDSYVLPSLQGQENGVFAVHMPACASRAMACAGASEGCSLSPRSCCHSPVSSSPRAVQLATGLTPSLPCRVLGSSAMNEEDADDGDDGDRTTCCFEKALHCLAMVDKPRAASCPSVVASPVVNRPRMAVQQQQSKPQLGVPVPGLASRPSRLALCSPCGESLGDAAVPSAAAVPTTSLDGDDVADSCPASTTSSFTAVAAPLSPASAGGASSVPSSFGKGLLLADVTATAAASTLACPSPPAEVAIAAAATGASLRGKDAQKANPAPAAGGGAASGPAAAELEPQPAAPAAAAPKAFHHKSGGPCDHCGAVESPQWRRGPPAKPMLCNACGTRFRRTNQLGPPANTAAGRANRAAALAAPVEVAAPQPPAAVCGAGRRAAKRPVLDIAKPASPLGKRARSSA